MGPDGRGPLTEWSRPTTSVASLLQCLWRRELRPRGQQTRDKKMNCTPTHQCGAGVRPSLEGLPYPFSADACSCARAVPRAVLSAGVTSAAACRVPESVNVQPR